MSELRQFISLCNQAEDVLVGAGGMGTSGSLVTMVRRAREAAEQLGAIDPDAPVVTGGTLSHERGTPLTYQIQATTTGSPITSYGATNLPAGLTLDPSTGEITGTPTTAVQNRQVTLTATNLEGTGRAILRVTIYVPGTGPGPGPGTVPWANDLTYSFPLNVTVISNNPGEGQIPLATLTNWDPAYQADFTDQNLYLGPNAPTSPATQSIRLFATFTPPGTPVEVEFDAFTLGTSGTNKLHVWGYDSSVPPSGAIYIVGSNSTGNPIELRLVKA